MIKRKIFYSFHYENDAWRVQQIRNIGVVEGNLPASSNEWEEVKRKGDMAIKKWIDDNMNYRSCVIVLVGSETANRKWVKYEIEKAWKEGKGLFGIYIHNLKDRNCGTSVQGKNPFEQIVSVTSGQGIKCYDPMRQDAYKDIQTHIKQWIEDAIIQSEKRLIER